MLTLLVLATVLLLSAATGQDAVTPTDATGRPTLITSPRTCLREVECAASQYCDTGASERLYTCQARGGAGERCVNVFGNECLDGLYCGFVSSAVFQPSCARQIPLGGACQQTAVRPCLGNNTICRRSDNICAPFQTGFANDPCVVDGDCQQDGGFYCMQGTCRAKKPAGAPCGQGSSNNECEGLCATGGTESSTGTCAPVQSENGPCREDAHCKRTFSTSLRRTAQLVCNIPRGDVGKCVWDTALIRELGAACKPSLDTCDARRGLSCRWAASRGRFVCQQRVTARDSGVARYCTPGSPLSNCPPLAGLPLSCQRDEGPDLIRLSFMGYFGCLRSIQVVPRGRACHKPSYVTCAIGTTCQLIPGVRPVGGFRQIPVPTRFCVRTVGIGASCVDKFSTKCAPNLACLAGRCVASAAASSPSPAAVDITHADIGVECSQLPCVPGSVCALPDGATASSARVCVIPTRVRGEGQLCFESALVRRVCAPGLICAQNIQGRGLLVCRKPGPLGAVCQNDDECRGNLKCSPFVVTSPPDRRCYNPARTLPIGASCNPNAPLTAPRCIVTTVQRQFIGNVDVELRCLPKATGFACQRVALLFQQCDPLLNITCISGAVCSPYGVCVPSS